MKAFSIVILSFLIFVMSFGNSLIYIDYQINQSYYEMHCVNKKKPEIHCKGKCKMKKDAEKNSQQTELLKLSFELNFIPKETFRIQKSNFTERETNSKIFYDLSQQHIIKGFSEILPQPPKSMA